MIWSRSKRILAGASGLLVGIVALSFGLTIIVATGHTDGIGGGGAIAMVVVSLAGFYLLCSAMWAGWTPSASVRLRVRSMRIALSWTVAVGLYMVLSLPLVPPSHMTTREWIVAFALVSTVAVALFAIVGINRRPRLATALLGGVAVYGVSVLAHLVRVLLSPAASGFAGPIATVGLFLAGSMWIALVGASLLAWPLRFASTDDRAI